MSRNLQRYIRVLRDQVARLQVPQAVEDAFGPYRDNPTAFCREVLGVKSATRHSNGESYQFRILEDVARYPRVVVRSGHGVGKSGVDAFALVWWLLTRPLSRVVVLAPEYSRQIKAILFSEVRKWVRRSKVPLPLQVLSSRVLVGGYGEEWSATGMSTAGDTNRIEGWHAEGGVLVIVDEMKGVLQDAFDAVQGALSGLEDSRLLVTSVPGGAGAGPFWKACRDTDRWTVHHIPSTDSSLVNPRWVKDRARDWGVGSPLYSTRVMGEFGDVGEGVLFSLELIESAIGREREIDHKPVVVLGVDVARSVAGDFNAIAVQRGGILKSLVLWREPDLMKTVERVLHEVTVTGAKRIRVDCGGVGAGVADRLRELKFDVDDVFFGGKAKDTQRFVNARAEMYWRLREGMEADMVLPDDDELRADLSAIRYVFTQDGRIQIESKDDCRKRLGRSPDRADAVVLALGTSLDDAQNIAVAPWSNELDVSPWDLSSGGGFDQWQVPAWHNRPRG